MENQNGKGKQLKRHFEDTNKSDVEAINQSRNPHSLLLQSSQEHFVFDMDILNENRKHKQDDHESEGHFSSPDFGSQSPFDSSQLGGSATQSPEPNTLAQSSGYDPKRIPTSIFSTKPTTPMDWSVASNESLFSIHLGNASFSKENFLLLYKSGELARLDDQSVKSGNETPKLSKHDEPSIVSKPDESIYFRSPSPPMNRTENRNRIPGTNEAHNQPQKLSAAEYIYNSTRSEGSSNSTTSIKSFAFPVLENDGGRNATLKMEILKEDREKQSLAWQHQHQHQSESLEHQSQEQLRPQSPAKTSKTGANNWLSCIPCFSPRGLKGQFK